MAENPKDAQVPELLDAESKVRSVVNQLRNLQQEAFDLEVRRVVAGDGTDQPMTGGGPVPFALPGGGGDAPTTYEQRFRELAEAQRRLVTAHADLIPRVQELADAGTL